MIETTIKVKINDEEIELSFADAKEMYENLGKWMVGEWYPKNEAPSAEPYKK